MTYQCAMLQKQDNPRLDGLKARVRDMMEDLGQSLPCSWHTQDDLCEYLRFACGPVRADSVRRMLSYLKADGMNIVSRRRAGTALAEYQLQPPKQNGQIGLWEAK